MPSKPGRFFDLPDGEFTTRRQAVCADLVIPKTDDRALYMNVVMNGLVKEGWEFAGITHDEIVMKRGIQ